MFGKIKGIELSIEHYNRFWEKVNYTEDKDDCWYWGNYSMDKGYGRLNVKGHVFHSSQVSLALSGVDIKENDMVLHSKKCIENAILNFNDGVKARACCNPRHLRIGTAKDNVRDTMESGSAKGLFDGTKYSYGETHYNAKLSEKDIIDIRKDKRHQYEIAKDYGVNPATISRIKSSKRRKLG